MKRPNNITKTGEYIEPNSFEKDSEAVLFYAYLELEKYVDYLENNNKKRYCFECDTELKDEALYCSFCRNQL